VPARDSIVRLRRWHGEGLFVRRVIFVAPRDRRLYAPRAAACERAQVTFIGLLAHNVWRRRVRAVVTVFAVAIG
jgi:hypothetical protein